MLELWFKPSRLHFQTIHVRGNTEWVSLELADNDGTFGAAEIAGLELAPAVARLADKLRGQKLSADDDVLHLNCLTPADLEENILLASAVSGLRGAVADALAKRADMPLHAYIRHEHNHDGAAPTAVRLYANINRSHAADRSRSGRSITGVVQEDGGRSDERRLHDCQMRAVR